MLSPLSTMSSKETSPAFTPAHSATKPATRMPWRARAFLATAPPATRQEARAIRDKALALPMLKDMLISGDGRALCLYLPLTSKDLSHKVYTRLKQKIATFEGPEEYHITGLPVAEDTFGHEMFVQMAVSAPSLEAAASAVPVKPPPCVRYSTGLPLFGILIR